jgi:protocatechuate 3,4-dioxygenase beta subunit
MKKGECMRSTGTFIAGLILAFVLPVSPSGFTAHHMNTPMMRKLAFDTNRVKSAALPEGATITGTLFNISPEDLESAFVMARAVKPDSVYSGSVGFPEDSLLWKGISPVSTDGTYEISGLAPGDYWVEASAPGYEIVYYRDTRIFSDATVVTLGENERLTHIDFTMVKIWPGTGLLSGTVQDETGHPVENASVVLLSQTTFSMVEAYTDESGDYAFTGLKNDSYIVEVYSDGYLPEFYDNVYSSQEATRITVADSSVITGIDFTLGRGGSISGIVTDSAGSPLEGVYIQASTTLPDSIDPFLDLLPGGYFSGVSDENGAYQIVALPDGEYLIKGEYYKEWGRNSTYYPGVTDPAMAVPVVIENQNDVSGIDFQIEYQVPQGKIQGVITDSQGNPVEGAYLSCLPYPPYRSAMWYWGRTTSDSTGFYMLENVPNDSYIIECFVDTGRRTDVYFWPGTSSIEEAEPVTISSGSQIAEHVDFQLPITVSQARISGQVAADGHPMAYASIQLISMNDEENTIVTPYIRYDRILWASSDSSGHYSLVRVPQGRYLIHCEYSDGEFYGSQYFDHAASPETADIIIVGDNTQLTADFELKLRPLYGALSGIVLNQDEEPVPGAYVQIVRGYANGTPMMTVVSDYLTLNQYTLTDDDGRYTFPRLYQDEYHLAVYANGGSAFYPDAPVWDASKPVYVTGGETTEADFKIIIRSYEAFISGRIVPEWSDWPYDDKDSTQSVWGNDPPNNTEIFVVTARPTVTLLSWPESERVYSAVTMANGNYTLQCPPGEYYVQAFSADYLPEYYDNAYSLSEAKIVSTLIDQPAAGIDMMLAPKLYWALEPVTDNRVSVGHIYGQVTDEAGALVSGATVYLLDEDGRPIYSVMTDEAGYYDISGMPPGVYHIQANKSGIGSAFNGNVSEFDQSQGMPVNDDVEINLTLQTQTSTVPADSPLPRSVRLIGNYPNPFNPQTAIRFALPEAAHVTLTVYNGRGEQVRQIADQLYPAGEHQVLWTGRDGSGFPVSSGIYLVELKTEQSSQFRKMILVR